MLGKHPTGHCSLCEEMETVEHVLMSCRERGVMFAGLRKLGPVELRFTDVLESGVTMNGRQYLLAFLRGTGLLRKL